MIQAANRSRFLLSVVLLLLLVPACWAAPILQETARIALPQVKGRIDHLTADLQGKRLFVAALGNGSIEVIDIENGKVVHSLTGFGEPQGVLYMPGSGQLVATDGKADHATIVDALKLAPVGKIALPEDSDNVRLDSADGSVWIGAGSGPTSALVKIDPTAGKAITQINLRGHPESFQLEQRGPRIFVNVPTASVIQVLDRRRGASIADWEVSAQANFPMALDEESQRLFIGARKPARLIVYDTGSGKPIANLPMIGDADDMFFDSATRRLYVVGGEGAIQVFQQNSPDRYSLLETVNTRKGARTALLVREWGKLFLALPRQGQDAAEIRVFSAVR